MQRQADLNNSASVDAAIEELRFAVAKHYPGATFEQGAGSDPEGIYLWVTVDMEDHFELLDSLADLTYDIQVTRGLPVYVVPLCTLEWAQAELAKRQAGERSDAYAQFLRLPR